MTYGHGRLESLLLFCTLWVSAGVLHTLMNRYGAQGKDLFITREPSCTIHVHVGQLNPRLTQNIDFRWYKQPPAVKA